jgi:hypothetical protein
MSDESMIGARRSATGLRWPARLLALAVLALYLTIAVGEGGFPRHLSTSESIQMALFLAACSGLVLGWRWEVFGGALAFASITLFYANHYRLTGQFPRGFAFAMAAVPAALFIVAGVTRRRSVGLGPGQVGG